MYHIKGLMIRIGMILLWSILLLILGAVILFESLGLLTNILLALMLVIGFVYAVIDFTLYKKHFDQEIKAKKEDNHDKNN
ncbi:MAG: hypothetical protein PHY42_02985 [Bacilli bacterium]|nr:hypothetical protein [Bacilli bacterium]